MKSSNMTQHTYCHHSQAPLSACKTFLRSETKFFSKLMTRVAIQRRFPCRVSMLHFLRLGSLFVSATLGLKINRLPLGMFLRSLLNVILLEVSIPCIRSDVSFQGSFKRHVFCVRTQSFIVENRIETFFWIALDFPSKPKLAQNERKIEISCSSWISASWFIDRKNYYGRSFCWFCVFELPKNKNKNCCTKKWLQAQCSG